MEDNYFELEVRPVFENHLIKPQGLCARWRMNLLAISDIDKDIMFVAMNDTIFVHRLNFNGKPGEPIKKLRDPDCANKDHTINAIKVGKIGNEEVLVSVDEIGDIHIWFTSNLDKNPIKFSNNESTWGIALHGPKRLLAVSANSHEITIFNLKESGKFFDEFDEDNDLGSSDGEEPRTPRTYASVLTKISENDAIGEKAISVLRGHEHNIPNICFSACGRFLVSCSIDSTCRVWNIKTGELMQTRILSDDYFDLNDNDEWGWTANFVPKSAFKTVSSNCETFQHLTSNLASIPSSPRSIETMDSLNLYRQHLRSNLIGQRPNVRAPEDLHRMIISRNLRIRNREYEDGYIENGAHSESGTEEDSYSSNEGDSELESSEDDTDIASNNSDQYEDNVRSLNRDRLTEIEGSATPAYYDRADSATPVVENYTENNPDYRWSVGHELNILNNNHEQDENNSSSDPERETEKNHEEERSEERPTQSNTNTRESSAYSLNSPSSYTVSEDLTPASSHNTSFPPEQSVSPTYSSESPEYTSTNSPSTVQAPDWHEIEAISRSFMNTAYSEDNDTICSDDSLTIDLRILPLPSSSREDINNTDSPSRTSNDYIRSHVRIQPLGSSRSDCCPDLGLPDELVLYTTKYDLFLLDPKQNLKILHTEKDVVHKVDTRRFPYHLDFDRLNMVEVIPELSLMIIASQQGKVALTRLIRIFCDNGEENYYLYPEKYLPNTIMSAPLLGMFIAKHNKLQDPALFYYRLYLIYSNGTMFCYDLRRKKETNPLRMDNIFI